MLIPISVQIFRSFKPPLFFFRFILILISVQIFRSPKTPSFFSLNSCLFLYQSKSSVCSNPLFFLSIHAYSHVSPNLPFIQNAIFFFIKFMLIPISVQIFRLFKPPLFSLNSCIFLYQSKSSVRSNPLFFSLDSCLFSYQSKSSI